MFSVTITSKSRGLETSCIAALSTSTCSSCDVGNSARATSMRVPRARGGEVSSTLALSTLVTLAAGRRRTRCARCARSRRRCRRRGRWRSSSRARLLAEVDAARELTHDEQVGALDDLAASAGWRRRAREPGGPGAGSRTARGPCAGRAGPAPGAAWSGRSCPTSGRRRRRAGRRRRLAGGERLVGQRGAVRVDRRAAERACSSVVTSRRRAAAGSLDGGRGDLRADPVAGQDDDVVVMAAPSVSRVDVQAHVVQHGRVAERGERLLDVTVVRCPRAGAARTARGSRPRGTTSGSGGVTGWG